MTPAPHPLDAAVAASLAGAHRALARSRGRAATYSAGVATFAALPPDAGPADWADLAGLLGPGALADLFSAEVGPPPDWQPVFRLAGVQMVLDRAGPAGPSSYDGEVVDLGRADVGDALDLVERTRPGPFGPRTLELGRYVGVRVDGSLVAMAGERLRPAGWTELSAVCTAPEARGRGLAGRLVAVLAAGAAARGDGVFLHVVDGNPARALYERLGSVVRRPVLFSGFRVPEVPGTVVG
ncbi:GNAT family N-acetyltransferase [Nocardioides litoris]|uniref:GNAT family N-acetyltransferase n=1 Tax=Nocardioides litoris TaxID=1926648 RepID=UPI001122B262|nr:GNAT family N-acetyltransferase [Nocardioides litoris]